MNKICILVILATLYVTASTLTFSKESFAFQEDFSTTTEKTIEESTPDPDGDITTYTDSTITNTESSTTTTSESSTDSTSTSTNDGITATSENSMPTTTEDPTATTTEEPTTTTTEEPTTTTDEPTTTTTEDSTTTTTEDATTTTTEDPTTTTSEDPTTTTTEEPTTTTTEDPTTTTSEDPTTPTTQPTTDQPIGPNNTCTAVGLMCRNCQQLVQCMHINNEWVQIEVQSCDMDKKEYCLINQCSTDPNPDCPPGGGSTEKFICHNTGIFPDPFNCKTYHACVMGKETIPPGSEDKHVSIKCTDENYGYNPKTTYCDKKLTNKICPTTPPIPECKYLGQSGGIYLTSIYYICLKDNKGNFVPNLFMCPHGGRFSNGTCK